MWHDESYWGGYSAGYQDWELEFLSEYDPPLFQQVVLDLRIYP